jgi:hypothetical protein
VRSLVVINAVHVAPLAATGGTNPAVIVRAPHPM